MVVERPVKWWLQSGALGHTAGAHSRGTQQGQGKPMPAAPTSLATQTNALLHGALDHPKATQFHQSPRLVWGAHIPVESGAFHLWEQWLLVWPGANSCRAAPTSHPPTSGGSGQECRQLENETNSPNI